MTARKLASNIDANGKKIVNLGTPTGTADSVPKSYADAIQAYAISRANHTGTQLAATISDFDNEVRLSRLDQMAAPTNPVAFNAQRITGMADPSVAQDAATKNYVDAQLAGATAGQVTKGSVRVATTSNILITSPGTAIDGVTLAVGDYVLLTGQTTGSQNGPYLYNGSGTAMTRAANWDTQAESQLGSYWIVREGTNADKLALMTNDTFTLGTTTATFNFIGVSASVVAPYETDLGDGTSQTFTVTHNFNTKAVAVVLFRNASPYDEIDAYVTHATVNTVTVEPDEVWSSAQYHCVVSKL